MDTFTKEYMDTSLFQNTFILRRPGVENFADIIKIATMLIRATFNDSINAEELGIIYLITIVVRISRNNENY